MENIFIIGGGLAGLTSAYYLSRSNNNVTLLEASPKFGGRTYSIFNKEFDDIYDNGQHIIMGCYDYTLKLVDDLNASNKIEIQNSLRIPFVEDSGRITQLKAPSFSYPINLLIALLKFNLLSFKNRMRIVSFVLDLIVSEDDDLKDITVMEWMMEKNQNDETLKKFWEILVVGTLNTTPEKASAQVFDEVLREVFLTGKKASKMVIPKVGLSQLFVEPILTELCNTRKKFLNNEKLEKLIVEDNRVISIRTNKSEFLPVDKIILAIPPHAVAKLAIENVHGKKITKDFQLAMNEFNYESILNVHLWLNENPFEEKFYALVGSDIHWLFNHGKHISLTTSAADFLILKEKKEIIVEFYSELEKYFPIFKSRMVDSYKIIKEKRATFLPDCANYKLRKNIFSPFDNMCFAGDWTYTNLPATIEGAILSGKMAADLMLSKNN